MAALPPAAPPAPERPLCTVALPEAVAEVADAVMGDGTAAAPAIEPAIAPATVPASAF